MASIRKEIFIDAPPHEVWSALRDFGNVHERAARGFVTATQLDGGARIVTFANGLIAREILIDLDDEARRIAYSAVSERLTHHNASMQVFEIGGNAGRSRVAWITDLLPNELAETARAMIEQGAIAMKQTLERTPAER
jgi:Polyketide cyclase / dehydrase and lipid transport